MKFFKKFSYKKKYRVTKIINEIFMFKNDDMLLILSVMICMLKKKIKKYKFWKLMLKILHYVTNIIKKTLTHKVYSFY